jgi:hypothetical protein
MSGSIGSKSLHENMMKASDALANGRSYEAERIALDTLEAARTCNDFTVMAQVVPILKDARSIRWKAALAVDGGIRFLESRPDEETIVEPGCYLIEPPLVGADSKNLRLAALAQEVPVLTVCREPLTDLKLRPIVAIGRITVRARVLPSDDDVRPDIDWYLAALNELGETAIDSLDTGALLTKQIDGLLDRLDSIPDHAGLHDALEALCRHAAQEAAAEDVVDGPRG